MRARETEKKLFKESENRWINKTNKKTPTSNKSLEANTIKSYFQLQIEEIALRKKTTTKNKVDAI